MKNEVLNIIFVGSNADIYKALSEYQSLQILASYHNPLEISIDLKKFDKIDAFVCEYNLPGMNGVDFFKYLQSDKKSAGIVFILVSSEKKNELAMLAMKNGLDDYFSSPLNMDKFFDRIKFLVTYKPKMAKGSKGAQIKAYRIPLAKRIFDILVASVALLLISPLLVLVIIAIRLESKGKVYYTSKRVGTGYKVFNFLKLRSMRTGADAMLKDLAKNNQYAETSSESLLVCEKCVELGHPCSNTLYLEGEEICENLYLRRKDSKKQTTFVKIKDDPRITKVGKFIRNTSIDELPQLINVIKGDMSIVGNRPLPLYEAELLTNDDWGDRFSAPAGITGLWQVMARGKSVKMSTEERKQLDNIYAKQYSFWRDIKIILMTVPALFQKENV